MVNEVSKLIYNALIKYQAIYLPEVGTISVVRHSATISSKRELAAPQYSVELSLDNHAKSLVNIISEVVSVDKNRAEEIYSRWLDKAREGSVVTIDRVGKLQDNSFTADKRLIEALNNFSQPLSVSRRRSSTPIYIVLMLILIGTLGCGGWWYINSKPVDKTPEITDVAPEVTEIETPLVEDIEITDTEIITESEEIAIETLTEAQEVEEVIADWRSRDDIRHWVVVGSYSTANNAERAISDIEKRYPEILCTYYRLGNMYAVVVFGSADNEECQQFKRAHSKEFKQSWIHTPKKFK